MTLKVGDVSKATDTLIECQKCGKIKKVNFAYCLKNGWAECCGYTMRMINTRANIDEAVKKMFPALIKMHMVGKHKYDAFCHCRECEVHRKFMSELTSRDWR